jgi:hypothetical protein
MAISNLLGPSLPSPMKVLHFGWTKPRTLIVMWQWSMTHPPLRGSSQIAQRPFCSLNIASYWALVRPNFFRRNSNSFSIDRGERSTRIISPSVSPVAAFGSYQLQPSFLRVAYNTIIRSGCGLARPIGSIRRCRVPRSSFAWAEVPPRLPGLRRFASHPSAKNALGWGTPQQEWPTQ